MATEEHDLRPHIHRDMTRGWEFQKTITIGNLLTMLVLCGTMFGAWATMDNRVVKVETKLDAQVKTDERQDRDMNNLRADIRTDLAALNVKMDLLMSQSRQLNGNGR